MTDEKVPYIKCLCHTGKKVYKYWIATLAVIGVTIGLGIVISTVWKQIVDGCNYVATTIGTALGSIGYILSTASNNAWSLLCIIPWYWWVAFGVIAGPFILVAIYCAGKHYNIKIEHVLVAGLIAITVAATWGIYNLVVNIPHHLDFITFAIGAGSLMWWVIILVATYGDAE